MEHRFHEIAGEIARRASDGGASVADIEDILSSRVGGAVNCYPGTPTDQCYPVAFFVSLQGRAARGRGHLNFAQMLEEFVKHMQGRCPGVTRHAMLITNAWWHADYEKWYANIETVKRSGVMLEAYLIGIEGRVSPLSI